MEPYLGEIKFMSIQKKIRGWLLCDGSILPINQYVALNSLLGNAFGGNGTTTFGIPDLRGRVPVGIDYRYPVAFGRGAKGGQETVQLTAQTAPSHSHALQVISAQGTSNVAKDGVFAAVTKDAAGDQPPLYAPPGPWVAIDPTTIQPEGGDAAHNNIQPFTVGAYYIATSGIYPQRDE